MNKQFRFCFFAIILLAETFVTQRASCEFLNAKQYKEWWENRRKELELENLENIEAQQSDLINEKPEKYGYKKMEKIR